MISESCSMAKFPTRRRDNLGTKVLGNSTLASLVRVGFLRLIR